MNTLPGQKGVLLFAIASALCACNPSTPETTSTHTDSGLILLNQHWSDADRQQAWYTSFGSRLMPADWFLNLEQANNHQRFASEENLQRFGFAHAGTSAANPHNLPIGMTLTPVREGKRWVGLGCSGCHSGQIYFGNQQIHIDGGQANIDFQQFEQAAIDALSATLAQPDKLARLATQLREPVDTLKPELQSWTESLIQRQHINRTDSHYGRGRLDAFGQIFNAVTTLFMDIPENRREPNAPVSYPVLWDAAHLDLVQWNASAPNSGPGPLFQNATTALAVFGSLDLSQAKDQVGYPSSIELDNLGEIQALWYKLTAPAWPEATLGAIDPALRDQGRALYAENCLSCHALSNASDPKRKLKVTKVAVEQVGTDATMARNFIDNQAKSGPFEGKKLLGLAGERISARAPAIKLVAHATAGALLEHPLSATFEGFQSAHAVDEVPVDPHPYYYKARPLSGIWASAPYLHNGSVASLAELLSPETRRQQFYVGRVQFDPVDVGLGDEVLKADQVSLFDTHLAGNSNRGHTYGSQLSGAEKRSLIEYLKSL